MPGQVGEQVGEIRERMAPEKSPGMGSLENSPGSGPGCEEDGPHFTLLPANTLSWYLS